MKLTVVLSLLLLLGACKVKEPFTKSIQEDFELGEKELKGVQFYNSADIVLYKAKQSGSKGTEDGDLVLSNQSEEERIIIRSQTPGVLEKMEDGKMVVRFEAGNEKYLAFEARQDQGGRFYLKAKDWKSGNGEMQYGGDTYYATQGSGSAHLLVVMRKLNSASRKERVAKGVKVN